MVAVDSDGFSVCISGRVDRVWGLVCGTSNCKLRGAFGNNIPVAYYRRFAVGKVRRRKDANVSKIK